MRWLLIVIGLLFCASSALAIPVILYDQGSGVTANGSALPSGDITVSIWTAATGGTVIYNTTFSGDIANGSWAIQLTVDGLEYGTTYYKDYAINGVDLDFDGDERLSFTSPLGLINNQSFVNGSSVGGWTTNGTTTNTTNNAIINGNASVSGSLSVAGTAIDSSRYVYVNVENIDTANNLAYYGGYFSVAGNGTNEHSLFGVKGVATRSSGAFSHGAVVGVFGQAILNNGQTTDSMTSVDAETLNMGGSVNQAYGSWNQVTSFTSNSSIDSAFAVYADANALVNGSITNAYALYGKVRSLSNGRITNAYGLYLESITAGSAKNYSIYSAGGTNYFAGNVGIGTATPTQKLDVNGSVNVDGNITMNSIALIGTGTTSSSEKLTFNEASGTITANVNAFDIYDWGANSGFRIDMQPNDTARFSSATGGYEFDGSGNFSGTNAQVWVNGSLVCTEANGLCAGGAADGWTNNSANTSTALNITTSSDVYAKDLYLGNGGYGSIHPGYGRLFIRRDIGELFPASLAFQDVANSSTAMAFQFVSGNTANTTYLSMINSAGSLIETFRHSGEVGIGTLTPTQKLDVNGSVNVSGANAQVWVNGSVVCTETNGLCSDSSGWTSNGTTTSTLQKVGIGTTTPQSSFEINGSGSGNYAGFPSLVNVRIPNHLNWGLTYQNDAWGANNGFGWFLNNAGRLIFASWNGSKYYEPLSLDATSGYVTIGEYFTPNAQLHIQSRNSTTKPLIVQGKVGQSTNLQEWQNSSGTALAYVNSSGSLFVDNGSQVCTAANGLCAGGASGWTADATTTSTSLNVTGARARFEELTLTSGIIHANSTSSYLTLSGSNYEGSNYGAVFYLLGVNFTPMSPLSSGDALLALGDGANTWSNSSFVIVNSYFTEIARFTGTGRLGIGTSSPTQTLDVNGSVNVSGASAKLYAPEICLNGSCQTSWSGSVNITGMSEWLLAASDGQAAASVTNGTVVNITGGTGVTITRSATTIQINSTTPYQSSAAGWTNTSTTTSTDLVIHLTPQATPGSGAEGDIFYSSALHKLCYYNSTDWVTFDGFSTC